VEVQLEEGEAREQAEADLGFGRIIGSELEAPNMLASLV
jgi:hypothetical protein